MSKPTEAQIKEFWERCGVKYIKKKQIVHGYLMHGSWGIEGHWESSDLEDDGFGHKLPSYWGEEPPIIDLNNLFKYAVPKLTRYDLWCNTWWDEETKSVVQDDSGALAEIGWGNRDSRRTGVTTDKDPALALFWAIWEVIK